MLKMGYRRQIIASISFFVAIVFIDYILLLVKKMGVTCESVLDCSQVLLFGSPYQYVALPSFAVLVSLLPLFFLKEEVYKTWRRFAMVALPIGVLFIATSPTNVGGDFGFSSDLNKEGATILFSVLFTFISYLLIIIKSVHTQRSGWRLAGRVFLVFVGILCALWVLAYIVG